MMWCAVYIHKIVNKVNGMGHRRHETRYLYASIKRAMNDDYYKVCVNNYSDECFICNTNKICMGVDLFFFVSCSWFILIQNQYILNQNDDDDEISAIFKTKIFVLRSKLKCVN